MTTPSAKRISGYGVAIAATLASLPSTKADIVYYPGLNEMGTTPSTTAATILSFNLAGNVATDGSHVANEQFFADHAYGTTGSFITASSKLTFHANISNAPNAEFNDTPLAAGTLIGSGQTIDPSSTEATLTGSFAIKGNPEPAGNWSPGQEAYLGLKFDNAGTAYYGWAEITVGNAYTITLDSFAYDNTGGPIAAGQTAVPEPSQIALFALGAAGVAVYHRRRKNSSVLVK